MIGNDCQSTNVKMQNITCTEGVGVNV